RGGQRSPRRLGADADGSRQCRRAALARHVRAEQARRRPRFLESHLPAERAAARRDAYRIAAVRYRADSARAGPFRLESQTGGARRAAEAHRIQRTSLQGARDERAGGRPRDGGRTERNQLFMNTRASYLFATALMITAPAVRAGSTGPTITIWAGDEDQE